MDTGVRGAAGGMPPWLKGFVVGAALGVALLVGVFIVMSGEREPGGPEGDGPALDPAVPGTSAPVPGSVPSGSADVTGGPSRSGTSSAAPPEPVEGVAPAGLAFRLGKTLYVARADGSSPVPVGRYPEGPYALSPDGRTLAVVAEGTLLLIEVSGGRVAEVGPAAGTGALMGECPTWEPDSSHLLYSRRTPSGSEVRRVRRDGAGDARLTEGGSPSVSPDGRVVAVVRSTRADGDGYAVAVDRGRFRAVGVGEGVVTAVAAGDDAVWFGVLDGEGASSIHRARLDGTRERRLSGSPPGLPRAAWGTLRPSPDESRLAAVATGDDQVSRIHVIDTASGAVVPVSARRDAYFKGWSSDGRHLYAIEGNAYQGEPTALVRIGLDGSTRRTLVTGAQ